MCTRLRFVPQVLILVASALMFLVSCAQPQATAITWEMPFDQAVALATDGLLDQTRKLTVFSDLEQELIHHTVVIDPMIDGKSGQQTALTRRLEASVSARLNGNRAFQLLAFQNGSLPKAEYLLTGTVTPVLNGETRTWRLNLALTDLQTRQIAAQASAIASDGGLDSTPTRFYADSPVLVKDAIIEGYIRTTASNPGTMADATYLRHITVATQISEATEHYNKERYPEALAEYDRVLESPLGQQLRALTGKYMSEQKLGNTADAEAAFETIVSTSLAAQTLSVKFLFKPGTTDFWPDPRVSGPYEMWLRQIARGASDANVCLEVIGHTSNTGTESFNDALSLRRAAYVQQRLEAQTPSLTGKLRPLGRGFRENIVGIGTDDLRDAPDRRVEFHVVPCGTGT